MNILGNCQFIPRADDLGLLAFKTVFFAKFMTTMFFLLASEHERGSYYQRSGVNIMHFIHLKENLIRSLQVTC